MIGVNIYALHRDESVWEDPFAFKPERFIDGEGKLVNFEKTLAFGYGNAATKNGLKFMPAELDSCDFLKIVK